MSKKISDLTKHYCESYINAALLGAIKHCKFLSSQPEFSETYVSKKLGHIIQYIALTGNYPLLDESFINSTDLSGITFLNLITNTAQSGDLNSIKTVINNLNRFEDNSPKNYQYSIDFALRYAGEYGHPKVFNHLIAAGAKPNQWHVIYWTAKNGPKNTYQRLLEVNKLPVSTKRKELMELCNKESEVNNNWGYVDLSNIIG